MAKEVKVLVACGSGVATSTIAQEEIKDISKKCRMPLPQVRAVCSVIVYDHTRLLCFDLKEPHLKTPAEKWKKA